MKADEYQFLAQRTANHSLSKYDQLRNAAYGLNGEAGEVIDLLKKHEFQGHDLNMDEVIKELGDIAWYLALGCTAIGMPMSEVLARNIKKLEERYPDGFDADKSINRKD